MKSAFQIAIIGGSGLDDVEILENRTAQKIQTPYGTPSDTLIEGRIDGVQCVLLARHGRNHDIMPSNVNYRANIWALRHLGCTHLIVSTACGSLREYIKPGDLIVPSEFIDRTTKRAQTFFDGSKAGPPVDPYHISASPLINERVRELLLAATKELGIPAHNGGTIVTIEGPRYSSRAESNTYRQSGGDLINMTTSPEIALAKEAGLLYGSIAMATDYDCWRKGCDGINVQDVIQTFKDNVRKITKIIRHTVASIAKDDWTESILNAKVSCRLNYNPT